MQATYYKLEDGNYMQEAIADMGIFTKQDLESMLFGTIEVLHLDSDTCILVNEEAREKHLPKNKKVSEYWFQKNPEAGPASDFILGPAIYCKVSDIAHVDLLEVGELRPPMSKEERRQKLMQYKEYTEQEKLQCSLDNPDACVACGS